MTGKRYEGIFMVEGRYVKNWFELGIVWADRFSLCHLAEYMAFFPIAKPVRINNAECLRSTLNLCSSMQQRG